MQPLEAGEWVKFADEEGDPYYCASSATLSFLRLALQTIRYLLTSKTITLRFPLRSQITSTPERPRGSRRLVRSPGTPSQITPAHAKHRGWYVESGGLGDAQARQWWSGRRRS